MQIQSCIHSNTQILLSADKEVITTASKIGLKAKNIQDEEEIKRILKEI